MKSYINTFQETSNHCIIAAVITEFARKKTTPMFELFHLATRLAARKIKAFEHGK
jgi:hypothetical protein